MSDLFFFTYSSIWHHFFFFLTAGVKPDTLPVCAVVTWSRIKRSSGILLRDRVPIKWSIFSKRRPPLCLRHQKFQTAEVTCGSSAAMRGEKVFFLKKKEKSPSVGPLAWLLEKFLLWWLLSDSLSPSHSISPSHPHSLPLFSSSSASSLPQDCPGTRVWVLRSVINHVYYSR